MEFKTKFYNSHSELFHRGASHDFTMHSIYAQNTPPFTEQERQKRCSAIFSFSPKQVFEGWLHDFYACIQPSFPAPVISLLEYAHLEIQPYIC